MTGTNPPPGGAQQPGNHQETAQWWATPPAGTDSQPVQGDPTMLNYNPGQQVPDPTMLNYGGGYTPPPQPAAGQQNYGQAGYTSGPAPVQPGYASGPAPVQPGYASGPAQPQYPGGPPPMQPPGYGGYPQSPGPSGNKTGLIIGGIVGLVVLVGIGIGVVAVTSSDDPIKMGGDEKSKTNADGKYSMENITNACSLIDPSVLTKWAKNSSGNPEHTETQPTEYTGGSLDCKAGYTEPSVASKYHDNEADITLDVSFLGNSEYSKPDYDFWKQSDTGTTGSGRSSGDVTGIGEQGYWSSKVDDYSSFSVLDYTVAVQDSNVSVKVKISLDRGQGESVSKDEVATVAKQQVQKALDGLKK
ncbi:hypothetical protein [Nocardia sp. NPDC050406]|uniref:hypothetical protein n=1 Tax=Nocardia sp. NPDC050406 TaxID=3364318 RepID=UPI00379CF59D